MEKSIKDSKPRPKTWLLGTSWHGLDVQKMDFSTWIFPALLSWCFDIINWIEMAVCREQKEGLENVINVSPKILAIFSSDSLVMSMESAMSSRVVSVGHWLRKLVRTNRKESKCTQTSHELFIIIIIIWGTSANSQDGVTWHRSVLVLVM